jgi:phage anti-repressor protein
MNIQVNKTTIGNDEVNSVSARELHSTLEVKKAFTTWITAALETMGSIQGEDYLKLKTSLSGSGYQWDYIITLDLAKHIAMMSKVPKGKEIREYFIKVEKQHQEKSITELADLQHNIKSLLVYTDKMGEVVTDHDKRLTNLENNRRLENWMEKNISDAKMKRVYELANGDEKLAKKLHSRIWRAFKNRFHIPRYNELPVGHYEDGLMWLNNVQLHEVV